MWYNGCMSNEESAISPYRPGGLELTKKAAEIAGIKPRDIVLDTGCGEGVTLSFLRDKYGAVCHGIDCSEQMIFRAKESCPGIAFSVADLYALHFPDESFDAVFSECVMVLLKDPAGAVREAARVLKKGGHLIVSTLVLKEESTYEGNGSPFTASELCGIMNTCGLEVIHDSDETKHLTQYVADAVFKYGSLKAMIDEEAAGNEACIFPCGLEKIPARDIGYRLIIGEKVP